MINIEKEIRLRVLWPDSKNKINENVLNNNSLVCKLEYKNFSIMLTGDIEEIAENAKERLRKNSNYDMTIDNFMLNVWEEING